MRFAVDTGGTFTDLLVEDDEGGLHMFKAPTTPSDPIAGVLESLTLAAAEFGTDRADLLARGSMFIHGTTHAINAVITGSVARTALLATEGHGDMLVFREGGRTEPFNFTVPFPDPYVPRSLTFEVPGRLLSDGSELEALDRGAVERIADRLAEAGVEAVAVCLLWSIVNPAHEIAVGEILANRLPGIPVTLSHALNPSIREYRRASSAVIDASLKPKMEAYMGSLTSRLREAGYQGGVLIVTSQGGVINAEDAAHAPIHLINSGPSMAPIAGRYFADKDAGMDTAIVADTGGTTYDVSLIRNGRIPWSRETWIGQPYRGYMTGFPSVDVKSVGAGGGSIAWVDAGGMLHVGPQSAGADPGPVCYGRGGTRPTVTDASLVLGYLDPDYFLGGAMRLDAAAARRAVEDQVARPLGLGVEAAADAILAVATESMVQAIMDITVNQGIDPATALLIGGGGAAGLNSVGIARRLGCRAVTFPEVGAGLSAAGALMSDLSQTYSTTWYATSGAFDRQAANEVLAQLETQAKDFLAGPGQGALDHRIDLWVEARYPHQVWEIEVPLPVRRFDSPGDVEALVAAFHEAHDSLFAIADRESAIEVVSWHARVNCRLRESGWPRLPEERGSGQRGERAAYFGDHGWQDARTLRLSALADGETVAGPALIESPFTTVVVPPGVSASRAATGSLVLAV
ncbi:MAG: hydantoinase/oxoprolinase family protein [Azospirillaceae bacterium]